MSFLKFVRNALCAGLFLSLNHALPAGAQEQKFYVFGNSLFNHVSGSDTTTVPHWIALLSRQQGQAFTLDGEFGFLRNFISKPEPTPNWGFKSVRSGWNNERTSFAKSGVNNVIIVPANFIQYQSPSANYEGGGGPKISPIEATSQLMTLVEKSLPETKFYIYEGWAELSGFITSLPPSQNDMDRYYSYNSSAYHDWYLEYVTSLKKDHSVELIPVATVLAKLFTQAPLNQLSPEDLYVDDAPHGTATLYFLAAMITYSAVLEQPLPTEFAVPRSVNSIVAKAYPEIAAAIPELLMESNSSR